MKDFTVHIPALSRFALVGAASAGIYFGVFALIHEIMAVGYPIAVSCGYAAGVTFHFVANRSLTFKGARGRMSAQLIKYAVVATINYLVTLIVVGISVHAFGLSPHIGVVAALGITTLAGYALFAGWVFRPRREAS